MTSIAHLARTAPGWATIKQQAKGSFRFEAVPPLDDGTPTDHVYVLAVDEDPGGKISVKEAGCQGVLPKFCVERHINDDGTFCLYLNSTRPISNEDGANAWWHGLKVFLGYQAFSEKWRYWPHNALSHGFAADTQIEMEKVAEALGWQDEVHKGIYANKGWLGSGLPGLIYANGKERPEKVVNARSACPRRCSSRHQPASRANCRSPRCGRHCGKEHRPILRADCPNREAVEKVILLEHKRRRQEQAYIKELKRKGVTCCGTMDECALR